MFLELMDRLAGYRGVIGIQIKWGENAHVKKIIFLFFCFLIRVCNVYSLIFLDSEKTEFNFLTPALTVITPLQ